MQSQCGLSNRLPFDNLYLTTQMLRPRLNIGWKWYGMLIGQVYMIYVSHSEVLIQ